jgi:hypothetical protein
MKRGKQNRLDKARRKKRRRKEKRRAEIRKQEAMDFARDKVRGHRIQRERRDLLDSVGELPSDSKAPR